MRLTVWFLMFLYELMYFNLSGHMIFVKDEQVRCLGFSWHEF